SNATYYALTISGTATAANDLTLTRGMLNNGTSGNIEVEGDLYVNGFGNGSNGGGTGGLVTFNGTGAQALTYTSGYAPSITVDKASGALTVSGDVIINSFTHTQGTIDFGTTAVTLYASGNLYQTFNNTPFYDLKFS